MAQRTGWLPFGADLAASGTLGAGPAVRGDECVRMKVRVLGASGGIGAGLRTTSLLVDGDLLIDCGTGVGDLELHEMEGIRHVLLSHSHLDHIACLPLLIDTLFDHFREDPLIVHCEPETYAVLDRHIFNWKVWPDFFRLPDSMRPVMRYSPVYPGEVTRIGACEVLPVRVNHTVPGLGFRIATPGAAMAFSGDTTSQTGLWRALNDYERLDLLVVECAYSNRDGELCGVAKHYSPDLLAEDLRRLRHQPVIGVTHLKPGDERLIVSEIQALLPELEIHALGGGQEFHL